MTSIETTLYYANWCGHCHNFMGEWEKFSKYVDNSKEKNGLTIKADKFEESAIRDQKPTINGKDVRGFPTVKITVKNENGEKAEYEYNGKRTADDLIDHVTNHAANHFKKPN